MNEIETGIIHIMFPGDRSTGISDAHFTLKEESYGCGEIPIAFADKSDLEEFKKDLAELMERYITGYPCYCLTNSEYLEKL